MGQADKFIYAEFGNGHRENIVFSLDAGESVVCHFYADGNDDTGNKYYNLTSFAKKVSIILNNIATITHIGNQELKSPIRLGTANANTWKRGIEWGKITVRADTDSTTFEIQAS